MAQAFQAVIFGLGSILTKLEAIGTSVDETTARLLSLLTNTSDVHTMQNAMSALSNQLDIYKLKMDSLKADMENDPIYLQAKQRLEDAKGEVDDYKALIDQVKKAEDNDPQLLVLQKQIKGLEDQKNALNVSTEEPDDLKLKRLDVQDAQLKIKQLEAEQRFYQSDAGIKQFGNEQATRLYFQAKAAAEDAQKSIPVLTKELANLEKQYSDTKGSTELQAIAAEQAASQQQRIEIKQKQLQDQYDAKKKTYDDQLATMDEEIKKREASLAKLQEFYDTLTKGYQDQLDQLQKKQDAIQAVLDKSKAKLDAANLPSGSTPGGDTAMGGKIIGLFGEVQQKAIDTRDVVTTTLTHTVDVLQNTGDRSTEVLTKVQDQAQQLVTQIPIYMAAVVKSHADTVTTTKDSSDTMVATAETTAKSIGSSMNDITNSVDGATKSLVDSIAHQKKAIENMEQIGLGAYLNKYKELYTTFLKDSSKLDAGAIKMIDEALAGVQKIVGIMYGTFNFAEFEKDIMDSLNAEKHGGKVIGPTSTGKAGSQAKSTGNAVIDFGASYNSGATR